MKALILTDKKQGHENQSIALCRYLGFDYQLKKVSYSSKVKKSLSYLFDRLGIYTECLFVSDSKPEVSDFDLIISTGSTSFYPNKVLAKKYGLKNIAILHPKGYRLDFTTIFCPAYDNPPKRDNVVELPINLCATDEVFFKERKKDFCQKYQQKKPSVGFVIGGANAVSVLDESKLKESLERVFELTKEHEHWVTTSRRTSKEIEDVIEALPFDYKLINSRDPYNPIPAFIQICDYLFVTSDSASMVSETVSFGKANVEILMNQQLKSPNKFERFFQGLEKKNAVHIFDGTLGSANKKIDLKPFLKKAL